MRAVGPAGDVRGSGPAGDPPADGFGVPVAGAGSAEPAGHRRLGLDLAIYTGLRLGLIVVIAALLTVFLPLIVALFFAIILQLPLAWLLFGKQRRRVNEGMAVATAARRQHRQELRDALENGRD